jgi:hypothetical protein
MNDIFRITDKDSKKMCIPAKAKKGSEDASSNLTDEPDIDNREKKYLVKVGNNNFRMKQIVKQALEKKAQQVMPPIHSMVIKQIIEDK